MATTAFKITNKVTCAVEYAAADNAAAALDEMAKKNGATCFADLKDAAFGEPLPRSLFAISRGYWKSANLRGRFPTREAVIAACGAKSIDPRWVQFWHVESV